MSNEQHRLAKALKMQLAHVRALLEHPDRDIHNFHIALAGVLRSMLCDGKPSTLLALGRELSFEMRVWGPYPPSAIKARPPSFSFNALTVSTEPAFGAYEMSVEEYLDAPIGSVQVIISNDLRARSDWYTPRQLIKWAANKEGPSHFDPKSSATFQSVGSAIICSGSVTMIGPTGETPIAVNDNILQRMALIQIAQMTVELAGKVLSHYVQDET